MKLKGHQTSPFGRRFSKDHEGFDPFKKSGQRYRIEKRIADVWVPVSSTSTIGVALAFVAEKPEWTARIVRIADGAVVA